MRQWSVMRVSHLLLLAACSLLMCTTERTRAASSTRCAIVSSVGVAFGGYRSDSDYPLDSAGQIGFQCTGVGPSDTVTIQLNRGRANSFQPRALQGPGSRLEYNLFLDPGCTTIWGDGTNGTSVYMGRPSEGETVSVPIFGRVPPRQIARAGQYSDMIIVTVLY